MKVRGVLSASIGSWKSEMRSLAEGWGQDVLGAEREPKGSSGVGEGSVSLPHADADNISSS